MIVSNSQFELLIQNHLRAFAKLEPKGAKQILHALPKWRKSKTEWLTWWEQQNLELRIAMQSFLFWLVREETFPIENYQKIHNRLTPVQVSSKTIPVSLVESDGTPRFEGGIVDQEWTLFNYSFKRSNEIGKWNISYTRHPNEDGSTTELDLILSALSYEIRRNQRIAKIGFVPHYFQESTHSQTEAISIAIRPTIHKLPAVTPPQVEKLVNMSKTPLSNGLTIEELLRVRHRAIVDSSNESKLITLWGTIEIELGNEEKSEKLLTEEEIDKLRGALREIISDASKRERIIDQSSKLKKKTKNDVIKEEIKKLGCSMGKDIDVEIQKISKMRGRLAHGSSIDKSQRLELLREVTFLFTVIDELIENKITEVTHLKHK